MRKTPWSQPTTWDEVCRRAAGRARYNSVRAYRAEIRRGQVVQLLHDLGWRRGIQAQIARHLGVSEATLSRDMARILPLFIECQSCGWLRHRHWAEDD